MAAAGGTNVTFAPVINAPGADATGLASVGQQLGLYARLDASSHQEDGPRHAKTRPRVKGLQRSFNRYRRLAQSCEVAGTLAL
jgi:hypothetical protein